MEQTTGLLHLLDQHLRDVLLALLQCLDEGRPTTVPQEVKTHIHKSFPFDILDASDTVGIGVPPQVSQYIPLESIVDFIRHESLQALLGNEALQDQIARYFRAPSPVLPSLEDVVSMNERADGEQRSWCRAMKIEFESLSPSCISVREAPSMAGMATQQLNE